MASGKTFRALASDRAPGSQAQSGGGPIYNAPGPALEPLAATGAIVGTQPESQAKCFSVSHRLMSSPTSDLSQVYAGDTVQMSTQIKMRREWARAFPSTSGFRYQVADRINFDFHAVQGFVRSLVA